MVIHDYSPSHACRAIVLVRSRVLHDCENVAFTVLEPSGFRAARGHDTARTFLPGHVVVLELDAARLQLGHLALDVVDVPERLARARRPGIRCRIEEARRMVAKFVDDSAR